MKNLIYAFCLAFGSINAQGVVFTFPDAPFQAGQPVEMPCRAFGFVNMAAFQWGILYDTAFLKLDSIKATNQLPEYGPDNFGYFEISQSQFIKPGSIYTVWTGVPCRTLEEGSKIFTAYFTAKTSGSLAGSIVNYPQGMAFEAINCQFEYLPVSVIFTSELSGAETPGSDIITASPNPFNTSFQVNQSGTLTLYDISGRTVYQGEYMANTSMGAELSKGIYFGIINNTKFKIVKQ